MTPADFARQLEAELEFDFPFAGITLRLREWTEPQYFALLGQIPPDEVGRPIAAVPVLVPPAVIGWSGITWRALGGSSDEPLPFDRSLVPHVFNLYRGAMSAALVELDKRYAARQARREAELGN